MPTGHGFAHAAMSLATIQPKRRTNASTLTDSTLEAAKVRLIRSASHRQPVRA